MNKQALLILISLISLCVNGNSSVNVKRLAFDFLRSRNEYIDDTIYCKEKNTIYIRDLHTEKETVSRKCICFFGVYNELQNKYLLLKNYDRIIFIDPCETKLDETLEVIRTFFKGRYPYNMNLIKKDIRIFYKWNRNKVIIVDGVAPKLWTTK